MHEERPPWEQPLDEAHWQALLREECPCSPTEAADTLASFPDAEGVDVHSLWPGGQRARDERACREEAFWEELRARAEAGEVFEAPVIGANKGGLLVRIGELIGFVPASQLVDVPASLGSDELAVDLEAWIGRTLSLRLIEVDRSRNRIICSERATACAGDVIDRRLDELEARIGTVVSGRVRALCDFGAFVDLGGVDGLIHISELSWLRIRHPREVVVPGAQVSVLVLHVDRHERRVALSLKRLEPDPWADIAEVYHPGDITDAFVTHVVSFGAFARIAEGVEGLIHLSEMADREFGDVREIVAEGQQVRVRILHVDPVARRLGLSLRQVGSE